jgi:RimJ/RimL family protein N-acetyltransferase
MADDTILETERLVMRKFRGTDLPYWIEHMNTPEVRAHLGEAKSPAHIASRLARVRSKWNEADGGYLALIRRADGEFLGECGCSSVTAEAAPAEMRDELEVGWQLRADRWGHGYATEAARALLDLIFGRFGRDIAFSQTSEANRGSRRVMERLGMTRREDLDYDDPDFPPEENPSKVYCLRREEWVARNG